MSEINRDEFYLRSSVSIKRTEGGFEIIIKVPSEEEPLRIPFDNEIGFAFSAFLEHHTMGEEFRKIKDSSEPSQVENINLKREKDGFLIALKGRYAEERGFCLYSITNTEALVIYEFIHAATRHPDFQLISIDSRLSEGESIRKYNDILPPPDLP